MTKIAHVKIIIMVNIYLLLINSSLRIKLLCICVRHVILYLLFESS